MDCPECSTEMVKNLVPMASYDCLVPTCQLRLTPPPIRGGEWMVTSDFISAVLPVSQYKEERQSVKTL